MARAQKFKDETPGADPLMVQFDKGVALLSYGLLFISPFGVGLPALASLALAIAHRYDAHPITRSHYRYQGRLFWTAVGLLVLGVILLVVGGGMEMTTAAGYIQARIGGITLPDWLVGAYVDQRERQLGDWMMGGGLVAIVSALLWLMLGSLWGFFKLVLGHPIGQRR